jgi:hypothetical protein
MPDTTGQKTAHAAAIAPLLLLLLACADSGDALRPAEAVDAVAVAPDARTLAAGDTATLTASLRSATGRVLERRAVTWASSDTAVALVSPAGSVRAGRAGMAIVSATSEGKTGRAAVTVIPGPLTRLVLDPEAATIAPGERRSVTALGYDAAGNVLRLGAVVWTTDNAAVATITTVGAVGIVTAGAPGTAVVTGTTAGRSARATITVAPPARVSVERVEGTPRPVVAQAGRTPPLTGVARGDVRVGRAVAWTTALQAPPSVTPAR